ncbi:hypothetical protein, partial [Methylosinus sporium]|uniref:hypothetical protein n=1 Tax=Methylosinus sporium TaxID=428 RepID=UPI001AED9DEC
MHALATSRQDRALGLEQEWPNFTPRCAFLRNTDKVRPWTDARHHEPSRFDIDKFRPIFCIGWGAVAWGSRLSSQPQPALPAEVPL